MESQQLVTITCATPAEKFLDRKRELLNNGGVGKIAPFPQVSHEQDRVQGLFGDFAFKVKDRGSRERIPQAEVLLNGIRVRDGDRDALQQEIEVLGVLTQSVKLDLRHPISIAVQGLVTVNNSGTRDIKRGDAVAVQVPALNRTIPQRMQGATFPLGNDCYKLETVPLQQADYFGREGQDFLGSHEFYELFTFFARVFGAPSTVDAGRDAAGRVGVALGAPGPGDAVRFREFLRIVDLAQGPQISQRVWGSARHLLITGSQNVVGVAESDARPNEPFNILLTPSLKADLVNPARF